MSTRRLAPSSSGPGNGEQFADSYGWRSIESSMVPAMGLGPSESWAISSVVLPESRGENAWSPMGVKLAPTHEGEETTTKLTPTSTGDVHVVFSNSTSQSYG